MLLEFGKKIVYKLHWIILVYGANMLLRSFYWKENHFHDYDWEYNTLQLLLLGFLLYQFSIGFITLILFFLVSLPLEYFGIIGSSKLALFIIVFDQVISYSRIKVASDSTAQKESS